MDLIIIMLAVLFVPPLILFNIGYGKRNRKDIAKKYYIAAVVYLIVGLGICGSLIYGL